MVAAVSAAMSVTPILPAMAAPADPIVFFPYGDGATYSCTGGPPFVVDPDSPEGNCTLQQIGGLPDGLICDVPATITFVHDMDRYAADGRRCE
jgi:hypothetical protein